MVVATKATTAKTKSMEKEPTPTQMEVSIVGNGSMDSSMELVVSSMQIVLSSAKESGQMES